MHESSLYETMGAGFTDAIFLLGHADGLPLNDPYPVNNMRDALNVMKNDQSSPLLRAALEVYYAGAQDIWLVAVAPMSEYQPSLDLRTNAYYLTYQARLNATYEALLPWDVTEIVVPLEAPFNSTVDFLYQLAKFCDDSFTLTGSMTLGFLGTRGALDDVMIESMINDPRLTTLGDIGKWVSIYTHDGIYSYTELPTTHTTSVVATIAAQVAQLPLNRGMTNHLLPNISSIIGAHLNKIQIQRMAEAKLNACGANLSGRRGTPFQIVSFTDNTLAPDGSDFWSLSQMRTLSQVTERIVALSYDAIGTVSYQLFQEEVHDYLTTLVADGEIREYELHFNRDVYDYNKIHVEVVITPYHGMREIILDLYVSPEAA